MGVNNPDQTPQETIQGPTYNLAIVNIVVFVITTIWGGNLLSTEQLPIIYLGLSKIGLANGLVWTPITSIFVHGSLPHLGGNLIFLFVYGFRLEEYGYTDMGVYFSYVVTGVLAGLASLPFFGLFSVSVGASGAVFGLLGTNIGINRKYGQLERSTIFAVVILFILSGTSPNTNIFAHLFGLIFGYILGYSDYFERFSEPSDISQLA